MYTVLSHALSYEGRRSWTGSRARFMTEILRIMTGKAGFMTLSSRETLLKLQCKAKATRFNDIDEVRLT